MNRQAEAETPITTAAASGAAIKQQRGTTTTVETEGTAVFITPGCRQLTRA